MKEKLESDKARELRLERLREDTIKRDLEGLPSEAGYEKESRKTREWTCPNCRGGAKYHVR